MRLGMLLALVIALSSCAPMIVGRTPEPAAPGTFDVTVGAGYPYSLTTPLCRQPDFDGYCYESFGVQAAYYPLGSPLSVMVSQGLAGQSEVNYTLSVGQPFGLPLLRVGGKTLFYDEPAKLAADYGLFAGFTNAGLDAGLLASTPLGGAELYGALRAFGNYYYGEVNKFFSVTGALTLGVEADVSFAKGVFAELTFATSNYNGVRVEVGEGVNLQPVEVQPIGFSLLPAIGVRF